MHQLSKTDGFSTYWSARECKGSFCIFLDDTVLYTSSLTEHAIKFKKLITANMRSEFKITDKCEFLRKEVIYLGHIIEEDEVRSDFKKIEAVQNFPIPKSAKI